MENYLEGYEHTNQRVAESTDVPPTPTPPEKKENYERALYGHTVLACETANSVNSTIFVLGGADVTGQFRGELQQFDPENVSFIKTSSEAQLLDQGRHFHSTVVYNNCIYVLGGKGTKVFNDIQCLDMRDPENSTWVKIECKGKQQPAPRYGHSACQWRNKMVVFGGCDDKERPNDEVFMFDLEQHSWELITSKSPSTPAPRFHHTCVVVHDTMYLFGGRDADNHVWEFDLLEHTWNEIKVKGSKPSSRYGHTWTWVGGDLAPTLLMFGGAHGKEVFNQVWQFNIANNSWKNIPTEKKKDPPRYFHSAIVSRHGLLCFGGYDDQKVVARHFTIIPIRASIVPMVPEEIIMKVLEKLDMRSVVRSSRVCKRWAPLANDAQVWRSLVIQLLRSRKAINHISVAKGDEGKPYPPNQDISSHQILGDEEGITPSEHIKDLKLLPVEHYKKYLKFMKVKKYLKPSTMTGATQLNEKIKLTFVGETKVGKTTFLIRYLSRIVPTEYTPMVFDVFDVPKVCNGIPVEVVVWDVFGGVESYDRLRPLSYLNTDVFVLMFSLVAPEEVDRLKNKWVFEIKHFVPDAPFILVGTKADARSDPKVVQALQAKGHAPITDEQAEELAKEIGAKAYLPCSTFNAINIDKVVDTALGVVFEKIMEAELYDKKKCVIM